MKKSTFFLMLTFFVSGLEAASTQDVDRELACRIASRQLSLIVNNHRYYHDLDARILFTGTSHDTLTYYVVGFTNRPGFVIVSATRLMPPVFGVCEKDDFDTALMPPALKFLLRTKEDQVLRNLRQGHRKEVSDRFLDEWDFMETFAPELIDAPGYRGLQYDSIGPLLHTNWEQGWPYNAHTPLKLNFPPAGCGPIAMAQIMRYHEYPDIYDYSQMGAQHTEYNEELANLISYCGEAADTRYSHLGSATKPWDIDDAMRYVFGFSKARYDDISAQRASRMIKKEIEDGFPVIVDGYEEWNMFDWHIFVADGYKGLSNGWSMNFHINWGWGGSYDGWYQLDDCNPPGDIGPYNYNQGITHKITPPGEVIIENPGQGDAFPSRTPIPIRWNSFGRAADLDSALVIVFQWDPANSGYYDQHLNHDTVRVANYPGINILDYYFKKPAVALFDTGIATVRIIVFGHYGDNARYRYYSEEISFGVYHGEYMQFTSPSAGSIWQANMHYTVSWTNNPYTHPEFLIKYKKVSGPPEAPVSGQVVFRTESNSVDWLIPPTLEGTYYLEGTCIGDATITCRSGDFTIAPLPTLSVTVPVSNTKYQPGDVLPIRWISDATENMKITLTRWDDWDPADTLILAASTPNDGAFNWTIPVSQEPGTLYSVSVQGVLNPQIFDGVFYFTIQQKIGITSPVTGDSWEKSKSHYIEWTSNFPENIDFELYRGTTPTGNGASNMANDGAIAWTVPEAVDPGVNYRIRIHKTGDETIEDFSDYFSIVASRYIEVTNPTPNIEWQKGQSYHIQWTSNVPNGFKIELLDYRQNPPSVTLIHQFNYSGYSWTIPSGLQPGSLFKIRVTSTQYPEVTGSSEFFSITLAPFVQVTSPAGSSSWPTATNQTITWTDNISGDVQILLYKQSASPPMIMTIASATPSDGSFDWFIPQTLTPGTDYYIIVRSVANSTIMDGSDLFGITQGNYILVTAPAQGTQWETGHRYNITWNDNISANVMIILTKPSLGISDTIASSTPSDGLHMWSIPNNTVPATNYNLLIRSVTNPNIYDYSDPFEVYSSTGSFITVTSPKADSVWKMGTQRTITWDDNIAENIALHLYKGGIQQLIISASKSGNSHLYTVPTSLTAGTNYQVKATSTVNGSIYDFSPQFTITPADFIDFTGPSVFRMNDSIPITWNDNINEHVKIELLLADTLFSIITTSTESGGTYLWGVPGNLPTEQWYKIRISSVKTPSLSDVSNASPIYYPYHINVTWPEAGFVMLKDSSYSIQWEHNFINGEHYNIDLCKGGDSIRRIRTWTGPAGYFQWPINSLYDNLASGNDYSLKVTCYEHPDISDFSDLFSILDCDSVVFSAGPDTILYRNGSVDLIATDGFDYYLWTPMQCMTRVNHVDGGIYSMYDTVPVICMASFTDGCIKRDTLLLRVADPPCLADATYTYTTYLGDNQCNTFSFFNLSEPSLQYRLKYDFGDVTMIDTTSVMVTHSFPGPGTYPVTCTVYDPDFPGCLNVFTDSITIHQPPVIGFNYTISIDTGLFVPSVTGPGTYRVEWWIDSIPAQNLLTDTLNTNSLSVVFPANGIYQVCALVYDTLYPGCSYTYCEQVVISGIPACRNTTCYFATNPLQGYGSGVRNKFRIKAGVNENLSCHTISWNMGDGSPVFPDSLQFNYTYAPGTYIITMTVTDCGSCTYIHTDTIHAFAPLDAGLPSTSQGCDSVTLAATPGLFYYVWQDSTVSATLPVYSTGSYWVLVCDESGYYVRDTSIVSIAPTLNVSMAEIPVLCDDGIAYILTEGYPSGGVYEGNHISGNIFDIASAGPGFFPVRYYFRNNLGCSDTANGVIEVEPAFSGNQVLQNQYYTGKNYFTGERIFTGSMVTDTLPQGPCVFGNGSNTILKAQNRILMGPGTHLMRNCYLKAQTGPLNCLNEKSVDGGLTDNLSVKSKTAPNIFIGPNPADDYTLLYIQKGCFDGYRLKLYDAMGSLVKEEKSLSGKQVRLDLHNLLPGIYLICVGNGEESQSLKIVLH